MISIQEAVARTTITATRDQNRINYHRGGIRELPLGEMIRPLWIWPCSDEEVVWFFTGGELARERNQPLVEWMDEEGFADDFLDNKIRGRKINLNAGGRGNRA